MVEKKSILIVVCIILLLIAGFMVYENSFSKNQVTVDGTQFTLPDGYHDGINNELGDTNITNGTHSVFITKYNGTNITKFQSAYNNYKSEKGLNVTNSNFTIDDVAIVKSNTIESSSYWFIHKNKIYSIYSWNANPKMDSIVFELVKSME